MALLTLTDYARHRGCHPRAVEGAIAAGRIRRDERGMIDAEEADRDWLANTSALRSAAGKANGAAGQAMRRQLKAPQSDPKVSGTLSTPVSDIATLARSRAQREQCEAEMARLRLDKLRGELLPRAPVESGATMFYAEVRDAVLAVPDRLAGALTEAQRAELDMELRQVFERYTVEGAIQRLAS